MTNESHQVVSWPTFCVANFESDLQNSGCYFENVGDHDDLFLEHLHVTSMGYDFRDNFGSDSWLKVL